MEKLGSLYAMEQRYIFLGNTKILAKNSIIFVLKQLYGVNLHCIMRMCTMLGVNMYKQFNCLTEIHIRKLNYLLTVSGYVGNVMKKKDFMFKRNQLTIGLYKGLRTQMGLPCNGQRTKTNARTAKRLYLYKRVKKNIVV